ncbi:polysaccharide lyase [Flavisphingomonas formosensis]|uniref:polysaccharide lyase n=1 Tax=Flavisphingomonas formosensis TaxID=861534 RepID=UPI0018DFEE1C|nr:polysaccharide lyase [Sphingomonas formosensis]
MRVMLRRVFGWLALALGVAALGAHLIANKVLSMRYGTPVTLTFEPDEQFVRSESALFRGHADYAIQACCEGSTFTVKGLDGDAGTARGFRVRPTDSKVKGNFRSELRMRPTPVGWTVWYRSNIFVPADWKNASTPVIAMQWHGSKDFFLLEPGKYPPLELNITNDHWVIKKSWDTRIITTRSAFGNTEGISQIGTVPVVKGHWQRWTFRVHWSVSGKGSVLGWLGDTLVVNDRGPNAHRDLIGPYLKAGVYVPHWGYHGADPGISERVLYFDTIETRFGANPYGLTLPAGDQG